MASRSKLRKTFHKRSALWKRSSTSLLKDSLICIIQLEDLPVLSFKLNFPSANVRIHAQDTLHGQMFVEVEELLLLPERCIDPCFGFSSCMNMRPIWWTVCGRALKNY